MNKKPRKSRKKPPSDHSSRAKPSRSKRYRNRDNSRDNHRESEGAVTSWNPSQKIIDENQAKIKKVTLRQNPVKIPNKELQLDAWQQEVLDNLLEGNNVIVDAPTTAGKTLAIERFFAAKISEANFKAVYTTPIKSLANDKLLEFRDLFGVENVGIATGDIKENLNAPIIIATLECYRNSLLGTDSELGRNVAVFDEYHFLQDSSRGGAWEEAMILSPDSCQVMLLSASVDNAEDFCAWLNEQKKRRCVLVSTRERPVPLNDVVWTGNQWVLADVIPAKILSMDRKNPRARSIDLEKIADQLSNIQAIGLAPAIVYSGKRLSTQVMAGHLSKVIAPLAEEMSEKIVEKINETMKSHQITIRLNQGLYTKIVKYGIAYHHSGLPISSRIIIEALLKAGLLQFCCSTTGLAVGVNFAVRSAIFTDLKRPSDKGLVFYSDGEILQMLGRAGRRGSDLYGFSLWPSLEVYRLFGHAKREACHSVMRQDPTTFLGLVGRGHTVEQMQTFYSKSFLQFIDSRLKLTLIKSRDIKKALEVEELPCENPAGAYASYVKQHSDPCNTCVHIKPCHRIIKKLGRRQLSRMQTHLHMLGALSVHGELTKFGSIARYFPQNGGLLVANMIARGLIHSGNLLDTCQLAAACCIAHFKEIPTDRDYKFPFNLNWIEQELVSYYPEDLFPNLYDQPRGRRQYTILREFNPGAANIVSDWLRGEKWHVLQAKFCTEYFGQGDIMSLFTRVATYLQSMRQVGDPELREAAIEIRSQLVREPLASLLTF